MYALDTANFGEDDHLIGNWSECLSAILNHHELNAFPAEWSLDRVEMTQAQAIATMLGNDGTRWMTDNSLHFFDLCHMYAVDRQLDTTKELARFVFADGSALVEAANGWDIEGRTPFSWAGAE